MPANGQISKVMRTTAAVPPQATLLIVDDTPDNITVLSAILREHYRIKVANSGAKAIEIANAFPPDLILLDVMMPELDGYETCRRLKASERTRDIPIIFVTARSHIEDERRGLLLGAVDYISKPVSPPVVQARVATQLRLRATTAQLQEKNHVLRQSLQQRTDALLRTQEAVIHAMAAMVEARDNETGNHIRRTQTYVGMLAHALRDSPRFTDVLTEENIELICKSAPLHDIGKVAIPDHILLKPGSFTEQEWEMMKMHTTHGRNTILAVEKHLGESNEFLTFAREIAYSHHEKWDGSGYPQGLKGEEIPVSARLMAVADVYDAIISHRIYKTATRHDEAIAIMKRGHGTHFDPEILDTFLTLEEAFRAVAIQFADDQPDACYDDSDN